MSSVLDLSDLLASIEAYLEDNDGINPSQSSVWNFLSNLDDSYVDSSFLGSFIADQKVVTDEDKTFNLMKEFLSFQDMVDQHFPGRKVNICELNGNGNWVMM